MQNRITIEGYVTNRVWEWQEPGQTLPDVLFRFACYPDACQPGQAAEGSRPRPMYVTVRVPRGLMNDIPVGIQPEQHLIVEGKLASRDYTHTLADFIQRSQGDKPELPAGFDPNRVVELRSLNEVVATLLRIVVGDGEAAADETRLPTKSLRRRGGRGRTRQPEAALAA